MTVSATGRQGWWFARVAGEHHLAGTALPCVHNHWRHGLNYEDSTVRSDDPRWQEFFAAIRDQRLVIETTSTMPHGIEGEWKRSAYIGIFGVENVTFDGQALNFRYVERIASLT